MVKGLYSAYMGLLNQQNKMDVLTNNLANSATTGYKKEGTTAQSFGDVLAYKVNDLTEGYGGKKLGTMSMGVKIGENYTDYTQGSLKATGNDFDLALTDEGFFSISFTNKAGETTTKYSRDGAFTLNKEGYLVTKDGDFVLGTNGRIQLNTNAKITIDDNGNIFQDDVQAGKLALTKFTDNNYLEKYGENLYQTVDGATQAAYEGSVKQGFLEASNVSVVQEMVNLITVTRAYESSQKVMQTIDSTIDKAVNNVGRV